MAATAPLIVYPLSRLGRRVRSQTKRSQEELEHLTHIATEAFTGHRVVKAFGAEARETERFSRASAQLYRTYMRVTSIVSSLPPIMEFIGGLAVHPDGTRAYAAHVLGRAISVVDLKEGQVRRTVTLPAEPYTAVLTPDRVPGELLRPGELL